MKFPYRSTVGFRNPKQSGGGMVDAMQEAECGIQFRTGSNPVLTTKNKKL